MAKTAAEMVVLIDEVIEARLTGGAVASVGSDGTNLANESLENLQKLRAHYAALAKNASSSVSFSQITRAAKGGY